MSNLQHNKKQYYLALLICTIGICIPAFINNFPFIYSDTGTYIGTGFTKGVNFIRPALYGIFIRHMSLHESFWMVIIVQALIIAWFIKMFIQTFFNHLSPFHIILITAILTAATSLGVTTGMLMPDFSTPLLILSTAIIFFSKQKRDWRFILICIGLWFSIAAHHSHPYVLLLILLAITLRKLFFKTSCPNLSFKRLIFTAFLLLFGYLTIPTIHYLRKDQFVASKSQNVFLMGRINQMGLLQQFLEEKCPDNDYSICQYKTSIPSAFLWDTNSPLYKDGGWEVNNALYAKPIRDFFSSPYYLKKFAIKSLETGAQQFFSFNTVRLDRLQAGKWPQYIFEIHMPDTVPSLEKSAQNRGTWSNTLIDFLQKIIVFSSALILIYLFFFQKKYTISATHRNIAFLVLMGLLSNAFLCGGISMIAPRFQSRIIWIVPFFTLCMCHYIWTQHYKKTLKNKSTN